MGLDMYLTAERRLPDGWSVEDRYGEGEEYVPGWGHAPDDERARYVAVLEATGLRDFATNESPSATLAEQDGHVVARVTVAYWRKANAIHGWLVRNVQDGVDDCQLSPVSRDQLAALRTAAEQALAAYERGDHQAAKEALEPTPGFFFGSYDIDQWYAEDLRATIDQLTPLLDAPDDIAFHYHSSW